MAIRPAQAADGPASALIRIKATTTCRGTDHSSGTVRVTTMRLRASDDARLTCIHSRSF